MKIRTGFVTNSSSSSFVISFDTEEDIKNYLDSISSVVPKYVMLQITRNTKDVSTLNIEEFIDEEDVLRNEFYKACSFKEAASIFNNLISLIKKRKLISTCAIDNEDSNLIYGLRKSDFCIATYND